MSFLKTKDVFEEKPCETKEIIDIHDLDDDADYREKVNHISMKLTFKNLQEISPVYMNAPFVKRQ